MYAAQASASDAMAGNLDGYFNNNGGAGVSSAEDEFNGGEFDQGASAQVVIDEGIQYEVQGYLSGNANLLSQQYTQVGCGVATAGDGNAWVAIEYR
jgi:cysteine-rich secretory family protein